MLHAPLSFPSALAKNAIDLDSIFSHDPLHSSPPFRRTLTLFIRFDVFFSAPCRISSCIMDYPLHKDPRFGRNLAKLVIYIPSETHALFYTIHYVRLCSEYCDPSYGMFIYKLIEFWQAMFPLL